MVDDAAPAPRRPAPRGGRVPPHDLHAEESLLGAMMLEAEAIAAAAGVLRADDFYKPAHAHIFDAIHALYASGQPVDPVTVADELRRSGLLETVGGHQVLVDIMASTPATTNAAGYARIVEEHALLRRLIGVAGEIAEIGYGLPEDIAKALDRAESMVYDINQRRVTDSTAKIEDLLGLNLDRLEHLYGRGDAITGVPTGYVDLDELLSGLQPSTLVVVGARPSMGKCIAGDTPVVDPATGELRTAAELHRAGTAGEDVSVLTLDGGRVVETRPSAFVDDGVKPVYRVRTRSGREIRTTASHPFLTPEGWQPLADLAPGRLVGVPATIPVFGTVSVPADEVVLLAHLVMAPGEEEGCPKLWTENREVAADLEYRGARFRIGVSDRALPGGDRTWDVTASPELVGLARRHDIAPALEARRVPAAVFRLPRDLLARFLNRALGVGAALWRPMHGEPGRMVVGTRSLGLARDLQHLLLRFGIAARVCESVVAVDQTTWLAHDLVVDEPDQLVALATHIGLLGHEAELGAVVAHARMVSESTAALARDAVAAAGGRPPKPGGPDGAQGAMPEKPGREARGAGDDVSWDEIVGVEHEGDEQVYDLTIPGTHNFVAADVFVHNTSFALGMGAHAALHANRPVLLFSLEMGALELSQRLLCGEARIDSSRVRTGRLSEDDWSRISQAIGRLAAAPIWIDDNPNLTVMEIRAKARRLRSQVGDLGMVVVDYLQLMSGRSSAENRQVEVSEISRGLKILARELECPVVALSQLSRQLELRADKRPMLADLRESGCLTGDARVLRADTGAEVPIGDLAASGERDIPVWSLDIDLRLVPATMTRAFATGVKDCFELRLASGRQVTASANHPFLTVGGWLRLDELAPGSRIAVPRLLPAPKEAGVLPAAQVALLADVLPGGRDRYVPAPVFAMGDDQVAAFVDRLWAQGGGDDGTTRWFDAPGRRLLDDLRLLLLRLGEACTLQETETGYRLTVTPAGAAPDQVPADVWSRVRARAAARGVPPARLMAADAAGPALYAGDPDRALLGRVAEVIDDDVVRALATSDVAWDTVTAIEPRGRRVVYDATVESTHNFVANGITVENSIEQDADVVMFIYRDDVYHQDSPDRGQAEILVSKHRNGPTGVCRLAFLEQFTRFANMAKVD
jgi:replicative DNA helicase